MPITRTFFIRAIRAYPRYPRLSALMRAHARLSAQRTSGAASRQMSLTDAAILVTRPGRGKGHAQGRSSGSCPAAMPLPSSNAAAHALDGEIGRVQGLLVDPDDHRVTHVLLREGHLRGRKQVAIPVSAVTGIQDGVRLNITTQQVQDLPPVDIDHPS
jgi:PRC-barrel domain